MQDAAEVSQCVAGRNALCAYWLLMVGVLVLLALPIWEFEYPAMVDYPSHLARIQILRNFDREPILKVRYEAIRRPFPNLALELLTVYGLQWLDVPTAGKVALTLLMLLFAAGCHFVGCVAGNGRPVWLAPLAALLVYNSTFLYGFVNYNFGIAFFLLSLSTWLWYRRDRSMLRFLAATVLATATYCAHLVGICLLGVAIVLIPAMDWRGKANSLRASILDLVPLAPCVALYACLGANRGDTRTLSWGPLALKARHLMVCVSTYNVRLTALYSTACLTALAIVIWKARAWKGNFVLVLGGTFFLLGIVAPAEQVFSGSDLDSRLIIPAFVLALLGLAVKMPRLWARVAFMLGLGAMCARVIEIRHYWAGADALTRAQLKLFDALPGKASVFPIVWLPTDVEGQKRERQLLHATEYATVDKLVFLPQLISVTGQQPLMTRNVFYTQIDPATDPGAVPWEAISRKYGFIYSYGVGGRLERYLERHEYRIAESGKGRLYRIAPPGK